ncbi:ROK family protein [Nocardioides currus]|uniref:Glucokinase n=1 Tax=Nocardioides currus TaxID=2133958 RepID=A0A2R7YX61_9ACTN|nr:ROK family protein [Nocardioides currus]PUA80980.1 glucokinase [Nocardioides currus]
MLEPVVGVLDIGGTKTAAGLVDRGGAVLARSRQPTPAAAGAEAVLATAGALLESLSQSRPDLRLAALGVGSAGVIDPDTGIVLGATDALPGWAGTDLRGALAASTGVPVAVRNDVHAHALGEAAHGAGAGHPSMLFVAVGTGIGGALVVRQMPGGLLTGAHAAAGHVGHVPSTHAAGLACTCGGTGHLEALASGPGLVAELERRTGQEVTDLRDVAARAAAGDTAAREVVELGGRAVGAVVGGLVNVLDPSIVVVGGGVANLGARWWDALREAASAEVMPAVRGTPLVASSLGDEAALLGAASLAWDLVEQEASLG